MLVEDKFDLDHFLNEKNWTLNVYSCPVIVNESIKGDIFISNKKNIHSRLFENTHFKHEFLKSINIHESKCISEFPSINDIIFKTTDEAEGVLKQFLKEIKQKPIFNIEDMPNICL